MRLPHVLRAAVVLFPIVSFGCGENTPPVQPDPVAPPVTAPPVAPAAEPPRPAEPTGCNAGPGTFNENCPRLSPAFLEDVDAAINRVVARRPEMFNFDDVRGPGGYRINRGLEEEYHQEVMVELRRAGFCAIKDHNEIGVKVDNTLNDQFHIMVSSGHIRRGEASYRATCRPAWF
jgi:hypothetical protein